MGRPTRLVRGVCGTLLAAALLTACSEEPTIGPGSPCGEPPTVIEPLPASSGDTLDGIPGLLDVSACREGRAAESLPLGSAWMEVRRVDGCCEVWFGGETEDWNYDGSPEQFCRFDRSPGALVPVFVGRSAPCAGPAQVRQETLACTVSPPPSNGCTP